MRTKCRYADAYQAKRAPTTQAAKVIDVVKTAEEIAGEIDALHAIAKALEGTRLKQKAILVLLAHETGLSQATCRQVLEGLSTLRASVLK